MRVRRFAKSHMNKYFAAAFVIAAFTVSTAGAQTFSTPVNQKPRDRVKRAPAPIYERPVDGAIPRGARGGNPLQLLNPRAPQKYFGSIDDTITYDQYNPSRITGIILFGLRW